MFIRRHQIITPAFQAVEPFDINRKVSRIGKIALGISAIRLPGENHHHRACGLPLNPLRTRGERIRFADDIKIDLKLPTSKTDRHPLYGCVIHSCNTENNIPLNCLVPSPPPHQGERLPYFYGGFTVRSTMTGISDQIGISTPTCLTSHGRRQ